MTLSSYQKSVLGLQAFIFGLPLLSKLVDSHSGVPFAPLGDDVAIFRFFALLIIGVCAVSPYTLPIRWLRTWIVISLLFAGISSAALYLHWEQNYVEDIHFPASGEHPDGAEVFVIRGTERQPDLKEPYRSMPDNELIRNSGHTDARLEKAYTAASLHANRSKLFGTYVLSLGCFELLFGVIAKRSSRNS